MKYEFFGTNLSGDQGQSFDVFRQGDDVYIGGGTLLTVGAHVVGPEIRLYRKLGDDPGILMTLSYLSGDLDIRRDGRDVTKELLNPKPEMGIAEALRNYLNVKLYPRSSCVTPNDYEKSTKVVKDAAADAPFSISYQGKTYSVNVIEGNTVVTLRQLTVIR